MVIIGALLVIFSEQIYNFTGSIEMVEKRSPGSSRGFIKILGILIIILGIITFSGLWSIIFRPLAGIFFRPL
jgi:hypothetical protein